MTEAILPSGLSALREADPDRYLATLYAPQDKRAGLAALYAFNAEIAAVRDRIHQPLPGEIRLQWWRDVLASQDPDAGAGHPLAMALAETIRGADLPRAAFENALEARVFDLYDDPMPSRADLEGYLGETASALIQLAALTLDRPAAERVAEMAGHAGCAQGIAGLLRLLPLHRARGQCYIPRDILASAGATPEALIAGEDKPAIDRAVAAMAALGREHQAKFEALAPALPPSLRPAFLPAALTPAYLGAVERLGARAATETATIGGVRRHWLMFRHAMQGW